MQVRRGFPWCRDAGRVVTLGVFDGVHRGHARILRRLRQWADRWHCPAAVITFMQHPHHTLLPQQRPLRLALLEQCQARMAALGVDEMFLVRFTPQLAHMLPEVFIQKILVERLRLKHVVVGKDFTFGYHRQGDGPLLQRQGRQFNFGVSIVKPLRYQGKIISSSGLRKLVASGKVEQARQWLGWPYTLHGRVMPGQGQGTGLGLPTANLHTEHEILPRRGTYAVWVKLWQQAWPALCHIGYRPTFYEQAPASIEIHIPGWQQSLYHQRLEVKFFFRLRGERRFPHARALLHQVQRDWQQAQSLGLMRMKQYIDT